jgi:hypothetical protein
MLSQVLEGLTAVCISVIICFLGTSAAAAYGMSSQSITMITGITVCLATVAPKFVAPYVHAGERLAHMLMQVRWVLFLAVGCAVLLISPTLLQ